MYTEEEARKKICFETFTTFMITRKLNLQNITETSPQNFSNPCFASKCMAWRWGIIHFDEKSNGESRKGYCGLAGKE